MKNKIFADFIKEHFDFLDKQYKYEWNQMNEHIISAEKGNVKIVFSVPYREEGITITVENTKNKEYYNIFEIEEKLGFGADFDYLDFSENEKMKNFESMEEQLAYTYAIFFKKRRTDIKR